MKQFIIGGAAGLIETLLMHPLDVLKTRMMLPSPPPLPPPSPAPQHPHGRFFRLFCEIYSSVLPPLLCSIPWKATKITAFYQCFSLLNHLLPRSFFLFNGFIAGCFSGFLEAVVLNPFEVVKVVSISRPAKQSAVLWVWKRGLGGFYAGFWATCVRQMIFSSFYFVTYEHSKLYFDYLESNVKHLLCGFIAGVVASTANTPIDVVKTRLQSSNESSSSSSSSEGIRKTIVRIFNTEGLAAFYRGYFYKILRIAPGSALLFFSYELLSKWWP